MRRRSPRVGCRATCSARPPASRLPQPLRRDMEQRFGEPLGGVRVHADSSAADSAGAMGARAYTHQRDVVFGAGAFDPQSPAGRGLLAHELTHVLQQRRHGSSVQPSVADGGARAVESGGDAAEREAQLNAQRVQGPQPLTAQQMPTQPVQPDLLDDALGVAGDVGGAIAGAGEAALDAGGAAVEAVGEAVGSTAMALVERVAPELAPIIREGPMAWLRERIAEAFDGLAGRLNAMDPSGTLAGMLQLFTTLVSRAGAIVAALASGDCQPLLDAVGQLKSFVTDMAGAAWERLSEFLAPIGQFFNDLWSGYGAPAIEWLQRFAGGVWDRVQAFGTRLWNLTQPVRDAVGDAWGWVKEQLFGPEDAAQGDSAGGIVGWVTTKAGEAWEGLKAQTRPVWQPIATAAERVAELLPPPFLRDLGAAGAGLVQQPGKCRGRHRRRRGGGREPRDAGLGAAECAAHRRRGARCHPACRRLDRPEGGCTGRHAGRLDGPAARQRPAGAAGRRAWLAGRHGAAPGRAGRRSRWPGCSIWRCRPSTGCRPSSRPRPAWCAGWSLWPATCCGCRS